jgi:hypothetical protein
VESKLAGKTGTTAKNVEFVSTSHPTQAQNKQQKEKANSSEELNPPPSGN